MMSDKSIFHLTKIFIFDAKQYLALHYVGEIWQKKKNKTEWDCKIPNNNSEIFLYSTHIQPFLLVLRVI